MKGYDEFNTLLLPPRSVGEKLPQELLDYYEQQMKRLEEAERARREAAEEQARQRAEAAAAAETAAADADAPPAPTQEDAGADALHPLMGAWPKKMNFRPIYMAMLHLF